MEVSADLPQVRKVHTCMPPAPAEGSAACFPRAPCFYAGGHGFSPRQEAAQTLFFDMWYPQTAHAEETNVHYITKQDCSCVLDSGVCIGLSE